MRYLWIIVILSSISLLAKAEVLPSSSPSDKHVQLALYDPNQVYRISTMQGYITAIQFGAEERIMSVNIGDSSAWLVNVQNDIINLKPIMDHPDTNMNVLTTRGTYQFLLTAPSPKNSLAMRKPQDNTAFLVRFRYNNTIQATATNNLVKQIQKDNWNYTARGANTVAPFCVYDNGHFTFFDFGERQDLPAIFAVGSRGHESLINYHMQGKLVVVETIAKQFTLRSGEQVASVFNETSW